MFDLDPEDNNGNDNVDDIGNNNNDNNKDDDNGGNDNDNDNKKMTTLHTIQPLMPLIPQRHVRPRP